MLLDSLSLQDLALKYGHTLQTILVRYVLFAAPLFLVFYVWKKRELLKFKIQQKFPDNKRIVHEIAYSLLSLSVFALMATVVFTLRKHGYTKMYLNLSDHSLGYFAFSVVAFIVIHDAYFYWTHRFMHWKKIYPYVHKVHHMSTNPTPWAAYAFHPLEALIEVGILPVMVFLMPIHPLAILFWVLYQSAMNVMGHLGFELFPSGFVGGAFTKWHNTSTHHNMHHKLVTCNYGLYYNVWDRVFGTNHARYEEEFESVKTRVRQSKNTETSPELAESIG